MSQADLTLQGHSAGMMTDRPFAIPTKKLAMWLFIIADTMTFAACLVAYGFLRNATPDWPRPFHSIINVAVMTFILLTSSLTMLLGVQAAKAGDKAGAFRWTITTALAGVVFAVLHIREWLGLIGEGMTMFKNPFSVTGLHITHVIVGVIALTIVGLRYKGGRYNADDIEIVGLYWHFVDLVWMFVVPFVYLLNLAH